MPQEGEAEGGVTEEMEREVEVEQEESEERKAPITCSGPSLPTEEGVDRHNTTHLPYRFWCPVHVTGRARTIPPHPPPTTRRPG